jgi:aspartyl-tRNA(Asn)/glutamyl-tRNA(Gln) amidotransferase subunit A
MVAFASSLDQAGPIAKTVEDAALMLEVMASFDMKDSTSLNVTIPSYATALTHNIKGLRVGIVKEYVKELKDEALEIFNKGVAWLKDAGCTFKDVSLPTTPYALPTYYIIAPAEASANLARYDGLKYGLRVEGETLDDMYARTRREGFGDEVRRRIMIGTYVLSAGYFDAYYVKAQKIQTLIKQDFDNAFKEVDVLLTPTTPTDAFAIDETPTDPVTMYLNDIFTVTTNLAGLPGISVPAGLSKRGLPLGLQLIGPKLSEQTLFNTALVIENAAQFKTSFDHLKKING